MFVVGLLCCSSVSDDRGESTAAELVFFNLEGPICSPKENRECAPTDGWEDGLGGYFYTLEGMGVP